MLLPPTLVSYLLCFHQFVVRKGNYILSGSDEVNITQHETKNYVIDICCFSAKHGLIRSHDNVSE